ncbi:ferric reductase NAD binding domain-containing protein [Coemansia mojavensis]|nr:ferric reductase NAD binding domain-containing protein [Coemansia mojavensis]
MKSPQKFLNRCAMSSILFDTAAILVFMSPTAILLLRRTFIHRFITLEKNVHAHKVAAYTMVFWSAVHIGIYYHKYITRLHHNHVPLVVNLFYKKTGWTGHVLMFSLFLMLLTAIAHVRRYFFEVFYFMHHLFVVFVVFLFLHHGNRTAYKYLSGPLALYLVDRLYRIIRSIFGRSPICAVIQHPSGVVEVQLEKRILGHKAGQYVKINCPDVSRTQWHPLTISSAPEEKLLTLHFRLVGGWTHDFAKRLGCTFDGDPRSSVAGAELPVIYVDGPYSAPSERFLDYNVGILIAAGIGVTPAAAILRSVYFQWLSDRESIKAKKIYLIWTYRDIYTLEWFKDLLVALQEEGFGFIEIHTYFTGKLPKLCCPQPSSSGDLFGKQTFSTSIGTMSYVGRPDFDCIFKAIAIKHPGVSIGTLFSGPKPMLRTARRSARKWNRKFGKKTGTSIEFYSEKF